MQLVQRKAFAVVYWIVAFAATVAGAVLGAHLGNGGAPEFGDSTTGASAGSHLLFTVGGGLIGGLVVLALFSGVWLALWARERRAYGAGEDDDDYGTLDDIENDLDADERAEREDREEQDERLAS